jgi:hypothetical protein
MQSIKKSAIHQLAQLYNYLSEYYVIGYAALGTSSKLVLNEQNIALQLTTPALHNTFDHPTDKIAHTPPTMPAITVATQHPSHPTGIATKIFARLKQNRQVVADPAA